MNIRPTTIERAYQLAESGECATVDAIKIRLRSEGFAEKQLIGPVLLADLRRRCREAAKAAEG